MDWVPIELPILLPISLTILFLIASARRVGSGRSVFYQYGMFLIGMLILACVVARSLSFFLATRVLAAAGNDLGVYWHSSQIGVGAKDSVPFIVVFAIGSFVLQERARLKGWLK